MVSPLFVDTLMLCLLVGFAIKGFMAGFIRSVVSMFAIFIAWHMSAAMPTVLSFMLAYALKPADTFYGVVNRIVAFFFFFAVVQIAGFVATGLLEKAKLGTFNRALGLILGVTTGVVVGSLPICCVYRLPPVYQMEAVQSLFKRSFFLRTYEPVAANFVPRPPRRPKNKA